MSLPLTVAGRSPVDPIRLRWGGGGAVVLGVLAMFNGAGGLVVGALLALLGVATWSVTAFGATPWPELSSPKKVVAASGAAIGLAFLYLFFAIFFLIMWIIRIATQSR